jgi:flagellar biosynthesis chaperone FliJ
MKRFHFPLDRVLRYRQLQAEAEEARLQAHLTRLKQVDERIAQVEREGRAPKKGSGKAWRFNAR